MSLKKYMCYDLLMLGILGGILEGLCVWCSFYILAGNIASVVLSILVLFTAIIRWKWWGLTISPLLALGSFVGAYCLGYDDLVKLFPGYKDYFSPQMFISILIGLLSLALIVFIIFRKKNFQEIINSTPKIIGLSVIAFLIYEVVKTVVYFITFGQCQQFISTYMYDLLALGVTIVGVLILNKQGFLINVKQKLIDDRKDRDEEASHEKFDL